jgi:hypothetical protein
MKLSGDGLTLWYATPDAPAPSEENASREGASLTIGVRPPSPSNTVTVFYRVDGQAEHTLAASEAGVDYARGVQFFRARFPPFPEGRVVEYRPVLSCSGRQVPPPSSAGMYPSRFTLAAPRAAQAASGGPAPAPGPGATRFSPRLEFVASVQARFAQSVDLIGETPIGLRVNYFLEEGQVVGPRLNGRMLPRGGDFLLIRRDGVGSVQVYATFETHDGARLGADYYGMVDLGEGGYERAVQGVFPELAVLQLAPRFMTGDARYSWVNRCQFVAVGQVSPGKGTVDYDLFLVSNDPRPGSVPL